MARPVIIDCDPGQDDAVMLLLAILTNITVVQRIVWVYQHSRPHGRPEPDAAVRPPADESHFAGPEA